MANFIKKFIVYFLAPLITLLLAAMKVPDWSNSIIRKGSALENFLDWLVVIGNAFIYYFSILSPHRKFEKAQKRKWEAMERLARILRDEYKAYDLSINIMLIKPWILYMIEPSKRRPGQKKFTWYGNIFKKARELTGPGVHPDFKLTINQGVCGSALREGKDTSKQSVKGVVLIPGVLASAALFTDAGSLDNFYEKIANLSNIFNILHV